MTPVIVTLVSELLHRPTERITRGLTSDSPALPDPEAPARRVAERLRADEPIPDPDAPPPRPSREAPVRIYRSEPARPPAGHKRRIAYRAALITAGLAFAIAAIGLTVTELIAGNSLGKSDRRTTLIPAKRHKSEKQPSETQTDTTPQQTDTQQQTVTETTTQTETQTSTAPAPSGGQSPGTDTTGTTTTP